MDFSEMTFSEFMFHGRYHIAMVVCLVAFISYLVIGAIREARLSRPLTGKVGAQAAPGGALLGGEGLIGATMMDGGEPVASDERGDRPREGQRPGV